MEKLWQHGLTKSARLARALTTAAFVLSILQYLILDPSEEIRAIPILVFCLAAGIYCMTATSSGRQAALASIFHLPVLVFALLVAAMPTISATFLSSSRAMWYGVLMAFVLISARILVTAIGLPGILRSFYIALSAGVPMVVSISATELLNSLRGGGGRYSPLAFHPNWIGNLAAILIPLNIWIGPPGAKWKVFRWASSALALLVVIASGSRSGLVTLIVGCTVAAALQFSLHLGSWRFKRSHAIVLLVLMVLLLVFFSDSTATGRVGGYLWDRMALDSPGRGLDSGMSGRVVTFDAFRSTLTNSITLFGRGFRTTSEDGYFIDNGYLSSLYEIGVIPLCAVLGKYIWNLALLVRLYFRRGSSQKLCLLMYICLICTHLLTATVERALFSYGDPSSLLALCFLVATNFDFHTFRTARPATGCQFSAVPNGLSAEER